MIYLDHAATTQPDEAVVTKMNDCLTQQYCNPSSAYSAAGAARKELRIARSKVAALLGARPEEIVFTSGGTESNAMAMWQAFGKHAVVFAAEHSSVIENARRFCSEITLVKPERNGVLRPEALRNAIRPDTALVSVQLVNNETGVIQPVEVISRICREAKVLFHVDAVQAAGHIPLQAASLGADLLSLSAHKLYGPRGAGCLFIQRGTMAAPLISGGGQEYSLRCGTENLPAIAGFGVAAELAQQQLEQTAKHEAAIQRHLENCLKELFPDCSILGQDAPRSSSITAVHFPGKEAEQLIALLDLKGFLISGGAACASHSGKPSHVYTAMGLSGKEAAEVIRISTGRSTTLQEINLFLNCLQCLIK